MKILLLAALAVAVAHGRPTLHRVERNTFQDIFVPVPSGSVHPDRAVASFPVLPVQQQTTSVLAGHHGMITTGPADVFALSPAPARSDIIVPVPSAGHHGLVSASNGDVFALSAVQQQKAQSADIIVPMPFGHQQQMVVQQQAAAGADIIVPIPIGQPQKVAQPAADIIVPIPIGQPQKVVQPVADIIVPIPVQRAPAMEIIVPVRPVVPQAPPVFIVKTPEPASPEPVNPEPEKLDEVGSAPPEDEPEPQFTPLAPVPEEIPVVPITPEVVPPVVMDAPLPPPVVMDAPLPPPAVVHHLPPPPVPVVVPQYVPPQPAYYPAVSYKKDYSSAYQTPAYQSYGSSYAAAPASYEDHPEYAILYEIADNVNHVNMGRNEVASENGVAGSYHVTLPDGRTQTVTYRDTGNGYRASVSYSYEYVPPAAPAYTAPAKTYAKSYAPAPAYSSSAYSSPAYY